VKKTNTYNFAYRYVYNNTSDTRDNRSEDEEDEHERSFSFHGTLNHRKSGTFCQLNLAPPPPTHSRHPPFPSLSLTYIHTHNFSFARTCSFSFSLSLSVSLSLSPVAGPNLLPEKVSDSPNFFSKFVFSNSVLLCPFL